MWLGRRKHYTPEEVRQRLLLDYPDDGRTAAVHSAASMTGIWHALLSERIAFDLGRSANRLPTVVYWYRQGLTAHEIGRRLSPFGSAWDADRALEVASGLIAQALNRGVTAARVA